MLFGFNFNILQKVRELRRQYTHSRKFILKRLRDCKKKSVQSFDDICKRYAYKQIVATAVPISSVPEVQVSPEEEFFPDVPFLEARDQKYDVLQFIFGKNNSIKSDRVRAVVGVKDYLDLSPFSNMDDDFEEFLKSSSVPPQQPRVDSRNGWDEVEETIDIDEHILIRKKLIESGDVEENPGPPRRRNNRKGKKNNGNNRNQRKMIMFRRVGMPPVFKTSLQYTSSIIGVTNTGVQYGSLGFYVNGAYRPAVTTDTSSANEFASFMNFYKLYNVKYCMILCKLANREAFSLNCQLGAYSGAKSFGSALECLDNGEGRYNRNIMLGPATGQNRGIMKLVVPIEKLFGKKIEQGEIDFYGTAATVPTNPGYAYLTLVCPVGSTLENGASITFYMWFFTEFSDRVLNNLVTFDEEIVDTTEAEMAPKTRVKVKSKRKIQT